MKRTRVQAVMFVVAVAGVLLCPSDRAVAVAPPPSLGALLPAGAVAALGTSDLRALLGQWKSSSLRKDWGKSAAAKDFEKSRVYLRLERNLAEVEEVAGTSITVDKLAELAGHRSVLGLYHVPTTSFVLVSELGSDEARASSWMGQKGRMAQREHRGVPYLLQEGPRGKASLAVALVGERLIAGTDLPAFRGALVLAARAAGLAVKPPEAGQPADSPSLASLADDPRWKALHEAVLPDESDAPVSVWVAGEALQGHYFDDYWVFGKDSAAGVTAAWLTLAPGRDLTVETRTYLYADGARPAVATDERARIGKSDVAAHAAALPSSAPFASAHPVDAAGVAAIVDGLLPLGAGEAADSAVTRRRLLTEALASAQPLRAVEVLSPTAAGKSARAEHHSSVAIALGKAGALDGAQLEKAVIAALAPSVGGSDVAFHDEGGVRALRLPLVPEWAFSWVASDGRLILATDPAAALELRAALAKPAAAALLATGAPRLWRLDVDRAASLWQSTTKLLAVRSNWRDPADADLFAKSLGGLFSVGKDVHHVVAYGYARGAHCYVEEVQYRAN